MQCPECNYVMSAFETECPRCQARPIPQAALIPETFRPPAPAEELYICRRCGAANPPTNSVCEICGETPGYEKIGQALRDPGVLRATVESVIIFSVLILCLKVFDYLPVLLKASVFFSTVIVLAWRFLRALEGRRG